MAERDCGAVYVYHPEGMKKQDDDFYSYDNDRYVDGLERLLLWRNQRNPPSRGWKGLRAKQTCRRQCRLEC